MVKLENEQIKSNKKKYEIKSFMKRTTWKKKKNNWKTEKNKILINKKKWF